jgi:hypothetical protein
MATSEKQVMVVGFDDHEHSAYALEWTLKHFFAPFTSNPPFKLVIVHAKPSPPSVAIPGTYLDPNLQNMHSYVNVRRLGVLYVPGVRRCGYLQYLQPQHVFISCIRVVITVIIRCLLIGIF